MTELGSFTWFLQTQKFERELSSTNPIFRGYGEINCDAEFKMEIDTEDEDTNAQKFRDYAAECRRLARTASESDRAVLIEIAEAWIVCAEQTERNARRHRKPQ